MADIDESMSYTKSLTVPSTQSDSDSDAIIPNQFNLNYESSTPTRARRVKGTPLKFSQNLPTSTNSASKFFRGKSMTFSETSKRKERPSTRSTTSSSPSMSKNRKNFRPRPMIIKMTDSEVISINLVFLMRF